MDVNELLLERIKYARDAAQSKDLRPEEVKQAVLLPILQLIGWDVWKVDEVTPDFHSDDGYSYDFALQLQGKPEVLIGVLPAQNEPEFRIGPIAASAFRNDCQLAVLTDGCKWLFYVPDETGASDLTLCLHVSLAPGARADMARLLAELLSRLLGKEGLKNGSSRNFAQELHDRRQKAIDAEDHIPAIWKDLVSRPDPLLVRLIADAVQLQCGARPENDMIEEFLKDNVWQFADPAVSDSSSRRTQRRIDRNKP